jgi:predicted acylesterase/phospholipase RssA
MIAGLGTRVRAALASALIGACGASCSTIDIVNGYNTGTHGTPGNPAESVEQSGARLVAAAIVEQMTGAYFDQGHGNDAVLAAWTAYAKGAFAGHVMSQAKRAHVGSRMDFAWLERGVSSTSTYEDAPWNQVEQTFEPCAGGSLSPAAQLFADAVRFRVAYLVAVATVSGWYAQRTLSARALERGANLGFDETRAYLENRRWTRDAAEPTRGLVLSGGASNGMFSAGATWVALHMIKGCISSPTCRAPDPRFRLLSGTSAGAMIATAVDLFNTEVEGDVAKKRAGGVGASRTRSLDLLGGWFTCLPANQLYCVEKDTTASLFGSRVGLANFDGIRYQLAKAVTPAMQANVSELILNTVDFQTGELLALSDQNPFETRDRCDVVRQGLASIPLPLIANPERELRVQDEVRRGFYLDGGVRATLPLLPVVRRGGERILVVSSSPLLDGAAAAPDNAVDLLGRYTSISSGATSEEGVELAKAFADIRHTRERDACLSSFHPNSPAAALAAATTIGASAGPTALAAATTAADLPMRAPPWWLNFCNGDFAGVCPTPSNRPSPGYAESAAPPLFEEIYRDEQRVDAASGYNFDPRESRLLFLAGAATVRERCVRLASFLGLDDSRENIQRWCNAPVPTAKLCEEEDFRRVFDTRDDAEARTCNEKDAAKSRSWGCP